MSRATPQVQTHAPSMPRNSNATGRLYERFFRYGVGRTADAAPSARPPQQPLASQPGLSEGFNPFANRFDTGGSPPVPYGLGQPALAREARLNHHNELESRMLRHGIEENRFSFWNESSRDYIDLDELWNRFLRDQRIGTLTDALRDGRRQGVNDGLAEHVVNAMDNTMFGRFLGTCTAIGSWELCQKRTCDTLLGLVRTINVECDQFDLASDPALPEIDLCCMAPDEETPWYGLEDPIKLCLPKRCKVKLAFGYKRDLCPKFRAVVQEQMNLGATVLRESAQKSILNILFDLYAEGQNPWSFCMDDIKFNPFYQRNTPGAPWANLEFNQTKDLDKLCNLSMFRFSKWLSNQIKDPRDGRPMVCCDPRRVIVASEIVADRLGPMLAGPIGYERCTGEACQEKAIYGGDRLSGFDGVFYDRCIEDYFDARMRKLRPGLSQIQYDQIKQRTMFIGCPEQFAGWQIEWALQQCTRSSNGNCSTWEDFNQEVIWATKYIWKVAPAHLSPWAGQLWKGLLDTDTKPAVGTAPTGPAA